ncbi:MAG: DUF5359 family protein [Vulcanibacillus sp.]
MNQRKRYLPYECKFIYYSSYIEKFFWKVVIICFILLMLSQLLLSFDDVRALLVPLERIEGKNSF